MLNVMQTIKDEVVNDAFVRQMKEFVENVEHADGLIVFVCNTKSAVRLLTTFTSQMSLETIRGFVGPAAHAINADALITVMPKGMIDGQLFMRIEIETMLERSDVFYPYERDAGVVTWKLPVTTILGESQLVDLLPIPPAMAQA